MEAVVLGAVVLDVLARPVEGIPEGQGAALLEEIRMAPAGAAGGTAVTLAKLGAAVTLAGAVGEDDLGEVLRGLFERRGVGVDRLVRRPGVQTSATVLPIRPNGERPALHVIGANVAYPADELPLDAIAAASHLHVGAPELLGPDTAAVALSHAREHGTVTSIDLLADGWPELVDHLGPVWEHVDWLLPNDDQVRGLAGEDDLEAATRRLLELGPGAAAVTCGADGCVVVTPDFTARVPALPTEVVDTSGCGDAFSAGFLRGLSLGDGPEVAAGLGCATASLVATGLGSDAGDFDLKVARSRAGP